MRNIHIFVLVIIGVSLSGCSYFTKTKKDVSYSQLIMKDYLLHVNKRDGISLEEAVLLARSEIVFRGYESQYSLKKPMYIDADNEQWVVAFEAHRKTLKDVIVPSAVYVFVDKEDGHINIEKYSKVN